MCKARNRKVKFLAEEFDVAVIGAGHAGIEAGLASARLGCKTGVFTINMDAVGNCPCNPSIGGTAKGHLVREIDALGGEMGKAADECFLQSRMLNRGKGPAVHSLRAQIDRRAYSTSMKHTLELQEILSFVRRKSFRLNKLRTDSGCLRQGLRLSIRQRLLYLQREPISEEKYMSVMYPTKAARTGCSRQNICRIHSKSWG